MNTRSVDGAFTLRHDYASPFAETLESVDLDQTTSQSATRQERIALLPKGITQREFAWCQ